MNKDHRTWMQVYEVLSGRVTQANNDVERAVRQKSSEIDFGQISSALHDLNIFTKEAGEKKPDWDTPYSGEVEI